MDERTLFLQFWENEGPTTRKVISRIPEEKCRYKPEPKSRSAIEIAWLLVMEEKFLVEGLEKGALNWIEIPTPSTVTQILELYDRHHSDLMPRLNNLDESAWSRRIPFLVNGQEVMNETGYMHGWITLFDQIHHRGQLSTYLRPMGSTVPSIYGPSADEQF